MTDYLKFTVSTADEAKPIDAHHPKLLREDIRAIMEDMNHVLVAGPVINGDLGSTETAYGDAACLWRCNKVKVPTSAVSGRLKKLEFQLYAGTTGGATAKLRGYFLPRYAIPGTTVDGDVAVAESSTFSGAADWRTCTVTIGSVNTISGTQAAGVGEDLQTARLGYPGLQSILTAGAGTISFSSILVRFKE